MGISFKQWKTKLNSDDVFRRLEALEDDIPVDQPQKVSKELIEKLLDTTDLIRRAAAEALSIFDSDDVRNALRACISREKDYLVKEYAISSLGEVANFEDLKFIIGLAEAEDNPEVLIHLYTGIAAASRNIATKELLSKLLSDNPVLKSSALNALLFSFFNLDLDTVIKVLRDEMKKGRANKTDPELKSAHSKFKRLHKHILSDRE